MWFKRLRKGALAPLSKRFERSLETHLLLDGLSFTREVKGPGSGHMVTKWCSLIWDLASLSQSPPAWLYFMVIGFQLVYNLWYVPFLVLYSFEMKNVSLLKCLNLQIGEYIQPEFWNHFRPLHMTQPCAPRLPQFLNLHLPLCKALRCVFCMF